MGGEIDVGQQLAQWAARMQSPGGSGPKQGPLDGMIMKGAASFTPTNLGPLKGTPSPFAGTGRGMLGSFGDGVTNAWASCGEAFINSCRNLPITYGGSIHDGAPIGHGLGRMAQSGDGGPDLP